MIHHVERLKHGTAAVSRRQVAVAAAECVQELSYGAIRPGLTRVRELHRPAHWRQMLHGSVVVERVAWKDSCDLNDRVVNFLRLKPANKLTRIIRYVIQPPLSGIA